MAMLCTPSLSSSPSFRRHSRPLRRLLVLIMRPFSVVPFRLPWSTTCPAAQLLLIHVQLLGHLRLVYAVYVNMLIMAAWLHYI